jgi:hypothetical protein
MGIEKAELKREIAQEIGAALEDVLDEAKIAHARSAGATDAYNASRTSVEGLLHHVDKEVTNGKYDLEESKLIKEWLTRATNGLAALASKSRAEMNNAKGKVSFGEAAVAKVKKVFDREDAKVAIRGGESANVVDLNERRGRAIGTHPGSTIKERRLAESAAEVGEEKKPKKKKAAKKVTKKAAKKPAKKAPAKKPTKKTQAKKKKATGKK